LLEQQQIASGIILQNYSSNLLTVAHMEKKLSTHTSYIIFMTTTYCLNNK
jgi:hypothetical protein